jgi:hypothetical protein
MIIHIGRFLYTEPGASLRAGFRSVPSIPIVVIKAFEPLKK